MTETKTQSPSDAEFWQLYMQLPGQHKDPIDFARAIEAEVRAKVKEAAIAKTQE